MNRFKYTVPLAIAFLVALPSTPGKTQTDLGSLSSTSPSVSSVVFNAPPPPPDIGQPGRRSDAGSRGCAGDESSSTSEPMPLLALMPMPETTSSSIVFGNAAAEYPTFWFYVPQRLSSTAVFVLQDQDGNLVYESQIALPEAGGIISLKLPTTLASLEFGKAYQWYFKLFCQSSSSSDSFVSGWIQRESLSPELIQQLQAATLQQQVRLYAEHGFWFDAVFAAAALRVNDPTDSTWTELLNAVGLGDIANEAIATP